jgi:hypothetical protein
MNLDWTVINRDLNNFISGFNDHDFTEAVKALHFSPELIWDKPKQEAIRVFLSEYKTNYFQALQRLNLNCKTVNPHSSFQDPEELLNKIKAHAFDIDLNNLITDLQKAQIYKHSRDEVSARLKTFDVDDSAKDGFVDLNEIEAEVFKKKRAEVLSGSAIISLPQFSKLSNAVGGFNSGRIILLVARTGFGKTTLALSLARSANITAPVAYINMEMFVDEMALKNAKAKNQITHRDFFDKKTALYLAPQKTVHGFYSTAGRAMRPEKIYSLCRSLNNQSKLSLIVIDYDQKLEVNISAKTQEWKAIQNATELFEEMAKELEVCVIMLCQEDTLGDVQSSKRSKNAASAVLRFTKLGSRHWLHAIKNRWGKTGCGVEIKADYDTGDFREGEYMDDLSEELELHQGGKNENRVRL